jgi:hypothetical protein
MTEQLHPRFCRQGVRFATLAFHPVRLPTDVCAEYVRKVECQDAVSEVRGLLTCMPIESGRRIPTDTGSAAVVPLPSVPVPAFT